MQNRELEEQLEEFFGAMAPAQATTFICERHGDLCHQHYLCLELIAASGLPTPEWAKCAITGVIMKKPVMDDLGRSYEREIYARQAGHGGQMRPYKEMVGEFKAYPNLHLQQAIWEFWRRCLAVFQ